MKILSMGDALIDFKATGPLAFQGFVGGSPLNVAVAAARLGAATGFASQLSRDQFGRAIRRHLTSNGVDTRFVLESEAASTLAFVGEENGEAVFDFIAQRTADVLYDPQPRPRFPDSLELLQFGSISLLQEPAATALTDIVRLHAERVHVVFDPNVRPALIADKAAYEARLRRDWLPCSHTVKVSAQDLRWLYPHESHEAVAHRWLEHGPQTVIVTDGGKGATLYQTTLTLFEPAPQVAVVDTVGAGDTFTGALMVGLLERELHRSPSRSAWQDALRYAAAAAALNCQRQGAQPPTRAELDAYLASSS